MAAAHRLSGVFAPVLTPFKPDLSVDRPAFRDFCRWLLGEGVGLAIFGTNSEANSLAFAERIELLDYLVDGGLPGGALMPGTGSCALPESVALSKAAVKAGAAAVLMLPPFFFKNADEDGLFAYYAETIERVGSNRLRVCLYHIPKFTGVPITLGLIERLIKRYPGTVVGLKDSSGDFANTLAVLKAFPGFNVFFASESKLLENMRNGGAGCISACANVNPAAIRRLFDGWQGPQATALQAALDPIRTIFETRPMIPALKRAAAEYGGHPGFATVRPPLTPLGDAAARDLLAALAANGFAMPGLSNTLQAA